MQPATSDELDRFLAENPGIEMLEVLMPDMNGIFRSKRIHRTEFHALLAGSVKAVATQPLVTTLGDYANEVDANLLVGEPDRKLLPVSGTFADIPWLHSPTGQVLASLYELDGSPAWVDPRHVLAGLVRRLEAIGLHPVIATELEFYLLAPGEDAVPRPQLGRIRATGRDQPGIQYALPEDLWENDRFLDDVRRACDSQGIPLITVLSEFAPGQWEINTQHVPDPLRACDHALLLKRIVKGVAYRHGVSATFMAKPFTDSAGCGLHLHVSLYNDAGENVFAEPGSAETPAISATLRHAVGGLLATMPAAMAVFAPNANSFRRFVPGTYVPVSPSWGYNHRDVSLRIPVSGDSDRRVEHRVAGADANPYLVAAAVLAGMHHGITSGLEPGAMVAENTALPEPETLLPSRWEQALDAFAGSAVMRDYFGDAYFSAFLSMRRAECEAYHAQVSNLDYEWYLRAV